VSPRQFFTEALPPLLSRGGHGAFAALVEFDIDGDGGGQWSVDFGKRTVAAGRAQQPRCVVRARSGDFMALVEGRMSASDGILTERLHVAGDVATIGGLWQALSGLRAAAVV
jgi:putative sterol carrier protein